MLLVQFILILTFRYFVQTDSVIGLIFNKG